MAVRERAEALGLARSIYICALLKNYIHGRHPQGLPQPVESEMSRIVRELVPLSIPRALWTEATTAAQATRGSASFLIEALARADLAAGGPFVIHPVPAK